jgi:hypothetical protein
LTDHSFDMRGWRVCFQRDMCSCSYPTTFTIALVTTHLCLCSFIATFIATLHPGATGCVVLPSSHMQANPRMCAHVLRSKYTNLCTTHAYTHVRTCTCVHSLDCALTELTLACVFACIHTLSHTHTFRHTHSCTYTYNLLRCHGVLNTGTLFWPALDFAERRGKIIAKFCSNCFCVPQLHCIQLVGLVLQAYC